MLARARNAFVGAGVAVALLLLTWVLAFHVGVAQRADQFVFIGFSDIPRYGTVWRVASSVSDICNPAPFVLLAAIPLAIAFMRRQPRLTLTVGLILVGANCTTQLLKHLLAEPRAASLFDGYAPIPPGSWPSGHATAAMSLALATVLAVPRRSRRAAAAAGALLAIAVSFSFLALGSHYPSDIVGGFLVAAAWTLLCVGALRPAVGDDGRAAADELPRPTLIQSALPAIALAVAALWIIVLGRPATSVTYARIHTSFVLGALAIAAFGSALVGGLVIGLPRR